MLVAVITQCLCSICCYHYDKYAIQDYPTFGFLTFKLLPYLKFVVFILAALHGVSQYFGYFLQMRDTLPYMSYTHGDACCEERGKVVSKLPHIISIK